MGIVFLPIMFYIPKFFEVRSHSVIWPYNEQINCNNFVHIQLQLNEMLVEELQDPSMLSATNKSNIDISKPSLDLVDFENITRYHQDCAKFNYRFVEE